jgi:DNA polymerase III alpha subunit
MENHWLFLYRKPSHVGTITPPQMTTTKPLLLHQLSAQVSSQSGMMKEYIFRHNHPPDLWIFMMFLGTTYETYGVMVYQEDVIKIVFTRRASCRRDILRRHERQRTFEQLCKKVRQLLCLLCAKGHSVKLSEKYTD